MKITEIQIGDWVYCTFTSKPFQIDNLRAKDGYGWIDVGVLGTKSDASLSPIPLTPEILGKNGFEFVSVSTIAISSTKLLDIHTSIHFQFINGKSAFVRLYHCGAGSYEFSKHINYVHELQHALRLCGLDELADNFKV